MIIFPAIDLINGQCVRLYKGDFLQQKKYNNDPVAQARAFEVEGAKWLHMVDLDAAKSGDKKNSNIISKVKDETTLKIQLGGGIRSLKDCEYYFDKGIDRLIIGTLALKDPEAFEKICQKFPKKIALGLDCKNNFIATDGWLNTSQLNVFDYLKTIASLPLHSIIFTDIARDGTLAGPNIESSQLVAKDSHCPLTVSGGVSSLGDLEKIMNNPHNIHGIICGKALYENKFSLKEAYNLVNNYAEN